MLIAQLTDVHLGFDPDNPAEFNRKRLDQVIKYLLAMNPLPDLLLATGDLADRGDTASYRRLQIALGQCPFPVWPCLGNHDDRQNFIACFPHLPVSGGFAHYEVQTPNLRILLLDTVEPGRHGGAFCEVRAAWLKARLGDDPHKPTLIVMHHPPVEVGIEWMNTRPDDPWVARFADAIEGSTQIVGIICGHLHRNVTVGWRKQTVSICASTAPQVALELAPIDPENPDGRPMIVADPPAFALHLWNGQQLITHFDNADEHVLLAKYDNKMQGLVRRLLDERPQ
jgi:3',5'-cyclic-AMP phosphodiesterase